MTRSTGSKWLFCLLVLSLSGLAWTGTAYAEESTGTVQVTLPAGAYSFEDTPDGQKPIVDDFGRNLIPGKPDLPAKIFSIAVPPGAQITGVTFDPASGIVLDGTFRISPVPLPRVNGDEDPALYAASRARYDESYRESYGSDLPYPQSPGEFVMEAGYRNYQMADVRFSPIAYLPQSGKLVYTPALHVTVHYTIPASFNPEEMTFENRVRINQRAKSIIHNYDQAAAWYTGGVNTGSRGLHDFVIITLNSLVSSVQPLVTWETTKGRTVEVVTTSWINSNYTGYDLAEKMRNFLRANLSPWGIEDVLLVGDYDDVPMRRCAQDVGYGQPETDYYYAELSLPDSQSWDKNGNHQWGDNTDTLDYTAEVNVGRIPWSNTSTVASICDKSAAFENNNDPTFKNNILLLGAYFWADTDNAVLMEYVSDPVKQPWMASWLSTRMYEKNSTYTSTYPCDAPLINANVMNAWPNGKYGFVNWAGHGSPTSCHIAGNGSAAFIQTSNCQYLNDDYPGIIFADACSNSDTDHLNLGKMMLSQGGVGFLGATKVAYGCPGWNHPNDGSTQSLDYYFTTSVTSSNYTQGEAHQYALRQMYVNGLWGSNKYETFEWGALWGNPDLSIEVVPALYISFPQGLPSGCLPPGPETPMTVEISGGTENYVPGSGKLCYRFDSSDPYSEITITPLGGNQYSAVLPNTGPGDTPQFYFRIEGDGGTTQTAPFDAPASVYEFDVAFVATVMEDDFDSDLGWTVVNSNVSTGAWERAAPQSTGAQPGSDHSPVGTKCFVTGPLAGSGDGSYDLDGGPTRLRSPILDLSGGDATISFYAYFYHSTHGGQNPLQVHISNAGTAGPWVSVMNLTHNPSWALKTFQVSDYVTPTANVMLRISATDNPNESLVEALIDDFKVERFTLDPALWADAYGIPASTGGTVQFKMDATSAYANRQYLLLGTASGSSPGLPLPGGVNLPINWDALTNLMIALIGSPAMQNFVGYTDGVGEATATLNTLGPVDPSAVGVQLSFAYFTVDLPHFASNPINVTIDP